MGRGIPNLPMPDGRMAALGPGFRLGRREESPGSTEARCRVTPGGGDPRESATENIPPSPSGPFVGRRAARVKWCGKSAPRRRQRRRQGKPHREQDQVGAAGGNEPRLTPPGGPSAPPLGSVARGVRRRTSQMNGHPRLRTGQNPAYRPSGLCRLVRNISRTGFRRGRRVSFSTTTSCGSEYRVTNI
jgi:hypothetical protein